MKKNQEYNQFAAKKKFGQHFLIDQEIILSIVENKNEKSKYILEVGPGPGVLTRGLFEYDVPLKVIEIDTQFYPELEKIIGSQNLVKEDALECSYDKLFEQWNWQDNIWFVSNLPYNIAAPLMIKMFPVKKVTNMTLMMQKEMADRIFNSKPKKQKTNSLYTYAHTFFDVSTLCQVPPMSFDPPPKVNSTVLHFSRKTTPAIGYEDYNELMKFCRCLFSMPRKQLHKVLKNKLPQFEWPQIFSKIALEPTMRAETLSLEHVHQLFFAYKEGIKD